MNKEIKRMVVVFVAVCILFVGLIVYLSYFQIFTATKIKNNSYNKRLWINEENILRGSIIDRNGKILAYSEKTDDSTIRHYNFDNIYSHIIGYSYREYGKAGLELEYNNELLNIKENTPLQEIQKIITPSTEGNSLKLTIDHGLQQYSNELLNGKKGSIVAMNPKTGEIYSMVSQPNFNPNTLREEWNNIMEHPDSPFLNRAITGLYTPGSTFKVITAAAALESPDVEKNFQCTGALTVEGYTLKDYSETAHGNLDLQEALVKSCNTYFANMGLQIGKDKLGEVADRFMINKEIPFDLPTARSSFPYKKNLGKTDVAASSFGQGEVLVTPLNMAMVASGVGNNGKIVKPILVKEVISPKGTTINRNETIVLSNSMDNSHANELKNMMAQVVNSGTGTNAKIDNIRVAGKTGTAENPSGKSHSWFIGFAPADDPKVAVSVILENEGTTGGQGAAPIARNIMIEAINNIRD